jgi:hypothetical protein
MGDRAILVIWTGWIAYLFKAEDDNPSFGIGLSCVFFLHAFIRDPSVDRHSWF